MHNPALAKTLMIVGILIVLVSALADPLGSGSVSRLRVDSDAWGHRRSAGHRGRTLSAAARACQPGKHRIRRSSMSASVP